MSTFMNESMKNVYGLQLQQIENIIAASERLKNALASTSEKIGAALRSTLSLVIELGNKSSNIFKSTTDKLNTYGDGILKLKESYKGLIFIANSVVKAFKIVGQELIAAFKFVNNVADNINSAQSLSQALGANIEQLMRLQYVAEATGSSTEKLNSSLEGFNQVVRSAKDGSEKSAAIFKTLGIDLQNCDGTFKNSITLFEEVREKMKSMSQVEQLDLMSKLGLDPSLLQLMTVDVSNFNQEFDSLSKKAGLDYDKLAEDSKTFTSSLGRVTGALDIVGKSFSSEMFAPFKSGLDTVFKLIDRHMPMLQEIFHVIGRIAGILFKVLGTVAGMLAGIFSIVWDVAKPVISIILSFTEILVSGFTAAFDVITEAALALWEFFKPFALFFISIFANIFESISNVVSAGYDGLKDALIGVITYIKDTVLSFLEPIIELVNDPVGTLKKWGTSAWNWLTGEEEEVEITVKPVLDDKDYCPPPVDVPLPPQNPVPTPTPAPYRRSPSIQNIESNLSSVQSQHVALSAQARGDILSNGNQIRTNNNIVQNNSTSIYVSSTDVANAVAKEQTGVFGMNIRNLIGAVSNG